VADYIDLPALRYFVLEESWVLDIVAMPGVVELKVDLTFAKDHPELKPARDGEVFYGRVGVIRFTGVRSLAWTHQGAKPSKDPNGDLDWDAIDSFTWLGTRHRLEGRFGVIEVDAENLECVLTGPT
jgi:hypothetical protein